MKRFLFLLIPVIALHSCVRTPPDISHDGGLRITIEASARDLIVNMLRPYDSIAAVLIPQTPDTGGNQQAFIDRYFDALQKADPAEPAGVHFRVKELSPYASATECRAYAVRQFNTELDRLIMALGKRLDGYGIEGATVQKDKKSGLITIELPGNKFDVFRIRRLIQHYTKLEFYETFDNSELFPLLESLDKQLAKEQAGKDSAVAETHPASSSSLRQQLDANKETDTASIYFQSNNKKHPLFAVLSPAIGKNEHGDFVLMPGPTVGYAAEKDTAWVDRLLRLLPATQLSGGNMRFLWAAQSSNGSCQLIALRTDREGKAALYGDVVNEARLVFDQPQGGVPAISMTMTYEAGRKWQRITRNNIGKSIAIVLDDHVYSFPTVQGEISGGISSITGNFTIEQAKDLANALSAGYFPVGVRIIKEEMVPASK